MDCPQPPLFAQSLIRLFAGPDMEDSILGDLEEQFSGKQSPKTWYWLQTIFSIPSLCIMNIHRLGQRRLLQEVLYFFIALILIWAWEFYIARQSSWPLTKQLLAYSPLDTGNTCRAIYIILYAGFTACFLAGVSCIGRHFGKGQHFQTVHMILFTLTASLPILYLCIFPLVTDGSYLFRVSQLGAVWIVLLSFLLLPTALKAKLKLPFKST